MESLTRCFNELTESEKRVFKYIYDYRDKVAKMKISDLAKEAYTSKTVVINLCQKMGFEGFADFKYYLKSGDSIERAAVSPEAVANNLKDNVNKTFKLMDKGNYICIAKELLKSTTVYVFARGTSKSCGYHLNHLLLTIGVKCIFVKDYNLLTLVAETLKPEEAVVLISLSGKTEKILEVAKVAKVNGTKIIAITSFENNELSRLSDYSLHCSSENTETKYNDSNSRLGIFIIIEMLVEYIKEQQLLEEIVRKDSKDN